MMVFLSAFLSAFLAGADPAKDPAAGLPAVDDIVVTGVRGIGPRKARPDAVEVLRAHCFDPARLTRRFELPSPGPRWIELDETERRQFQIEDPAAPAFGMEDAARGQHLWLKVERLRHKKTNTEEQICTLLVIGGRNHRRFIDAMSRLFQGPPTRNHVGLQGGPPVLAGWEQYMWTGMAERGVKSWKAQERARGAPPPLLIVVDPLSFYNGWDYIMGDMKSRTDRRRSVTLLTFSFTTRPIERKVSKPRAASPSSVSSPAAEPAR
jgi:hypothetical protein